jgi:transketolase
MPSWELFEAQAEDYRNAVLPPRVRRRISIEAGTTLGWDRYVGDCGIAIGVNHFGASAPGNELFRRYGFTVDDVEEAANRLLQEVRA